MHALVRPVTVIRSALAVAVMLCAAASSWAEPGDPAPVSDEVLAKLPAMHPASVPAFAQELRRHHSELQVLAGLAGGDAATEAHRIALRAKQHELHQIANSLGSDPDVPAALAAPLQSRLAELNERISDLAQADTAQHRQTAAKALKALLARLQPPVPDGQDSNPVQKRPDFREEDAPRLSAQPSAKRLPAFVAQAPRTDSILLAMNGTTADVAAVLPPLAPPAPCAYTNADIADDGRNVLITPEVRLQAQALGFSPARILQWVQQNIRLQPYYGAQKGSQATLLSKSGGPMDIDSLTIALLRASDIPARFVFGNVTIVDNTPSAAQARAARWLGVKTMAAANGVLNRGHFSGIAYVPSGATDATATGISFDHSWVEACVPYAHYRGSSIDAMGQRWVPMDPSFGLPQYQPGVDTSSVDLDYTMYMQSRSSELPDERYRRLVGQYALGLSPSQTLDQVPYAPTWTPSSMDVLPTSLPYIVNQFNSILPGGTSEGAALPDYLNYYVTIVVKDGSSNALTPAWNLYLPDIALKRVTLDFEGATPAAQTTLANWQKDGSGTSALPCPMSVTPVIRVDGGSPATGTGSVDLCTVNNLIHLSASIDLQSTLTVYDYEFPGVAAGNYHALLADALQNSDAVLSLQAQKLLSNVRSTASPAANLDAVEGAYLDLVGRKFFYHVDQGAQLLGQLDGTTGHMGHSVGFATTQAKVEYAFDLPFAVTRSGYLIDVAGQDRSVDLSTGQYTVKHLKLLAYMGSAYESYLWQENARLDAVSTVRGLQYAAEKGVPVLTMTNANWASQKGLLTSNANNSDTTLNYAASDVAFFESQYFCSTCSQTSMLIPQAKLKYVSGTDAWLGYVYAATISTNGTPTSIAMAIQGGHNGGYSLSAPIAYNYDPVLNTGYSYTTPAPIPTYSNWSIPVVTPPPPIISPAVGLGVTDYSTFAGDPVNLVNGNLYHDEQDIKIKGRGGLDISLARSYNSRDGRDGPLGFGWTHSLNQYLEFSGDTSSGVVSGIVWVDSSGSRKTINSNAAASSFTTPAGFFFTVARQADNTFLITDKSGLQYTFENKTASVPANDTVAFANRARLTRIADRNGNTLTLSYTAAANCAGTYLCKLTDGLNRSLTFAYNTAGRLITVTDWTARQWKYGYDTLGNLTSYQNPRAAAGKQAGVSYTYYSAADGANLDHAMKQYTLPKGNGMTFEYYINGWVFRHYKTLHPSEVVTFTYNDFRRETVVTDELGNVRHHFFDRNGNPSQVTEPDGGVRTYTYDCRSTTDCPNPYNKLSETDPVGVTTNYSYDGSGNLIKTQFPGSGATVQRFDFGANTFGQPRRTQDARGNWTLARYDASGNAVDSIVLKAGVSVGTCSSECAVPAAANISAWTHRTYDTYGNVTEVKRMRDFTNQIGPTLDTSYNDTVNNVAGLNAVTLTRTGDKTGTGVMGSPDVVNLVYDNLGRTTTGVDARWYPVQVLSYDDVDRATVAVDAVGRRIETDFDANGNRTEQRVMGGGLTDRTHFTINDDDEILIITDNAGATTLREYDLAGHVSATTNPDGWRVALAFDAMGRTVQTTDANNNTAQRSYDIGARLESQSSALKLTTNKTYYGTERDGRLKRVTLPAITGRSAGRATEYDYDLSGNVIRQSQIGDDATTRDFYRFYDEQNRAVREVTPLMVNSLRRQVCRKYSNLGDLIEIWAGPTTDATSSTCNYSDSALTRQVAWGYDDFGRKLSQTDPLGNVWNWTYDLYGNAQTAIDGKRQTTSYTWKAGGLPDTRTDTASHKTTWTYDGLFRLASVGDPNVTYSYTYDAANRVSSVKDSRSNKVLGYKWSLGGLLNRKTDGEGRYTDYIYEDSGRLAGQWLPNGDYVAFAYDADGRLYQRTASTGARANYTWFTDGSLASITTKVHATSQVESIAYTLNAYGQRATIDENLETNAWHWRLNYDNLGQINEAWQTTTAPTAGSESLWGRYQYDGYGNIGILQFASGAYLAYQYDVANQLREIDIHQTSGSAGAIEVANYDANGSLTTKQVSQGTTTYTWDELNRLKSVSIPFVSPAVTQSYTYDPLGRRIAKVSNGSTTNYLLDGPDALASIYGAYSSWSQPDSLYVQGTGTDQPLARLPLSSGAFQSTYDYHLDGLGSVAVVTQEQATQDLTPYAGMRDPWGAAAFSGGTALATDPGWQGRESDESGLSYFRARYYEPGGLYGGINMPVIGRFISRDPAGFSAGMNLYAFGGNDPVNMADPSGMNAVNPALVSGVVALAKYDNFVQDIGLGGMSSAHQSLGDTYQRPSDNGTLSAVRTTLAAASLVPGLGTVTGLAGAAMDAASGDIIGAGLSLASAVPIVGEAGAAARSGLAVERTMAGAVGAEAAQGEQAVYRVFGGDARAQGFSWTTEDPRAISNFRDAAGLPSGGPSGATNTADFMVKGSVNPADVIKSRSALPLDGNKGGLPELIIDPINVRITGFSVLKP